VSQSRAGGDLNGVSVEAVRATLRADFEHSNAVLGASIENNDQPSKSFKSGSIARLTVDPSLFPQQS
jgi:iron complex outermembrane receptor protein